MNSTIRKKLGLPKKDFSDFKKLEDKIERHAPVSLSISSDSKEALDYSQKSLKIINVGTLRNQSQRLVEQNVENNSFYELIDYSKKGKEYFFSENSIYENHEGELLKYNTVLTINKNNPYDPLFSSFDRVSNKSRFLKLTNNFDQAYILQIKSSNVYPINGFYQQSGVVNNKPSYFHVDNNYAIIWVSGNGWVVRNVKNNKIMSNNITYFSGSNSNNLPSGNWSSGINNFASGNIINNQGFYKKAATRISSFKNILYGTPIQNTGINLQSGTTIPNNQYLLPYPHSYNVKNYTAFDHNLIIVPTSLNSNQNITGFKDILIISTGISSKKIVYVSPHAIDSFFGFWNNTVTGIGVGGTGKKFILTSGLIMAPSSENYVFTGLKSQNISGKFGSTTTYYNVEQSRLKQATPIKDTLFYKAYESVYQKNAFNTGTWNGIIPKGTPFQIETVRTKNYNIGNSDLVLKIYSQNYFVTGGDVFSGDGANYTYIINEPNKNGLFANFKSTFLTYSDLSKEKAYFISEKNSYKKYKSKLYGALWEKGFTQSNRKVNRIMNLFKPSGQVYSYGQYVSGNLQFVYATGILTSAGVRPFNSKSIIPHPLNDKFRPTGETNSLFL